MGFFAELQWRGMLYDCTEGVGDLLDRERVTAYIGFDPTAPSLHAGSLLTVMGLARLQRFGHRPIAIVGGGTGMIGDPSGKSQERVLLSPEQVEANLQGIRAQLERFLDFDAGPTAALIVNNAEWLGTTDVLAFLRDVGKHFTVGYMLQKESVNRRMESEEGISYTEFSYLVLQAYDYLQLFDRHQCVLQMGGSDQWGNITAGIDLVRRVRGARVHGLVWPLMRTASGAKFGKTEAGAVWLDRLRTAPFRFYQFWLHTDDRDVVTYLKYFTWLDAPAIEALARTVAEAPERREAQRTLAQEVTRMVHGAEGLAEAERETAAHFGPPPGTLTPSGAAPAVDVSATMELPSARIAAGISHPDFLVTVGLAASKSEAVRLIKQGGFYLNDVRVTDERGWITPTDVMDGLIRARKGQRERRIVRVVDRVRSDSG